MSVLITQLLYGLALGMIFAMLAAGLSIVFGLMNVKSFAHGALYMLGAFIAVSVAPALGLGAAVTAAVIGTGLVGLAVEWLVLRPLYGRPLLDPFLATFGVMYVLVELVRIIWGDDVKSVPVPAALDWSMNIAGAPFPVYRLFIIIVGALLLGGLWLWLRLTRFGLLVQAASFNADLVRSLGVDVKQIFRWTFVLGAGLAAFAGSLAAPLSGVDAGIGIESMVTAIVVVIVGGVGSLPGAALSGLMIGVVSSLGSLLVPGLQNVPVYLVMILVLVLRPYGLLGRPE